MGFGAWSRHVSAEGTVKATAGHVNLPVVIGGQVVRAGDVVVADDDGVVVVPLGRVAETLTAPARPGSPRRARRAPRSETGELGLDRYGLRPLLERLGVEYVAHAGPRPAPGGSRSLGRPRSRDGCAVCPDARRHVAGRVPARGRPARRRARARRPRRAGSWGAPMPSRWTAWEVGTRSPARSPWSRPRPATPTSTTCSSRSCREEQVVTSAQPCGNMLAGVGPFAIERGLVPPADGLTEVRVRMLNTGTVATLRVLTPGGVVTYDGDTELSGVPGTAAPVEVLLDPSPQPLLPTGNLRDMLAGLEVTCVDNGMPCVIVRAADLGVTGERDARVARGRRCPRCPGPRAPRGGAATRWGWTLDPGATSVPKVVLVSEPTSGGTVSTRSFIPVRVHHSIGVVAAATVAASVVLPGTVAHGVARPARTGAAAAASSTPPAIVTIGLETGPDGGVSRTAVVRTARMILDGVVHPGPRRIRPTREGVLTCQPSSETSPTSATSSCSPPTWTGASGSSPRSSGSPRPAARATRSSCAPSTTTSRPAWS